MIPVRKGTLCGALLSLLVLAVVMLLSACTPGSPPTKGGKTCLDCHAEYKQQFSAGNVHKPVAQDNCAGCHRKHGLIGGAYLKAPVPNICFFCHQQFGVELGQNTVLHAPVKAGQCDSCHQPHNSTEKALLNKQRTQLCYDCHDQQSFTRKYLHAPVSQGCETCHATHGATEGKLLIKAEASLCQDCHNLTSSGFISKHGDYPVTSGCSECHSVHSADNPALLKPHVHQPVAAVKCQSCHAAANSSDPFAITAAADQLCASCHAEQLASFAADNAHLPAKEGSCISCHQVHASDFAGMIKVAPQQLCFECHSFNSFGPAAESEDSGVQHTPAKQGECLSCHGPHIPAAGQKALLRKPGNQLCLDCHAAYAVAKQVNHPPALEGDCLGCHLPHESLHSGVLVAPQGKVCSDCHEQVLDQMGLPSVHRPFIAGNCSACHNPHGSQLDTLLLKNGVENCAGCHATIETERQQPNRHQPFKQGRCELCHEAHGSIQPFLLVKKTASLCVECHQQRQIEPGTPAGHQNCAVCHHAHGNNESAYLLQEQPQLCLNCHEVDRFWKKGVGHQPAVDGQCLACHDPHAPQKSLATRPNVTLCGECHEVSAAVLSSTHKGIEPSAESCLDCHDPHGGPDRSLTLPVKHAPFDQGDCASCHEGVKK